jgi:hypothetical protein
MRVTEAPWKLMKLSKGQKKTQAIKLSCVLAAEPSVYPPFPSFVSGNQGHFPNSLVEARNRKSRKCYFSNNFQQTP